MNPYETKTGATTSTVTVRSLPSWATSQDVVVKRGDRYVLLSYQTEPRWRYYVHRWITWLRRWIDEH